MSVPAVPIPYIRKDIERISPEVVKKAALFAASILADVAGRRGTLRAAGVLQKGETL